MAAAPIGEAFLCVLCSSSGVSLASKTCPAKHIAQTQPEFQRHLLQINRKEDRFVLYPREYNFLVYVLMIVKYEELCKNGVKRSVNIRFELPAETKKSRAGINPEKWVIFPYTRQTEQGKNAKYTFTN